MEAIATVSSDNTHATLGAEIGRNKCADELLDRKYSRCLDGKNLSIIATRRLDCSGLNNIRVNI